MANKYDDYTTLERYIYSSKSAVHLDMCFKMKARFHKKHKDAELTDLVHHIISDKLKHLQLDAREVPSIRRHNLMCLRHHNGRHLIKGIKKPEMNLCSTN